MIVLSVNDWTEFKTLVDTKKLTPQYSEAANTWDIYAQESSIFVWQIALLKGTDDATDFETNHKSNYNKPVNIRSIQILGEDSYGLLAQGYSFTATKETTTTHDYLFDQAYALKGGVFYCSNGSFGDSIDVTIIDKDGILEGAAYPPGTPLPVVLDEYVRNYAVIPGEKIELEDISVGLLPAPGLYIRVTYHSQVGATEDVKCIMNIKAYDVS